MALKVKLILDQAKFTRGLTNVGAQLNSLTRDFLKWSIVTTSAIAGVSIKLATDLEYGLTEISTLMTKVTDKDISRMRSELQKLSRDSGQAIKPLLKARYDIVSAGFVSAAQSAMVLNQAVKLAVGGVTSAAQAADILTTALNSYSYSATDAQLVSDILFTTVRLGKTTMDELAASMGQMLPIARASDVSLSDAAASLALVTANGLDTAIAATALKNGFKALAAPSNHAKQALEDAGITLRYLNDGTLDLIKTMEQFKGRDFSEFRDLIPDIRAINALLLMANNLDKLDSFMEQTRDSAGATEVAFDKMVNTFKIKGLQLVRNLESPMQDIGKILIEKLTPFIDEANRILSRLGDIGWEKIFADIGNRWAEFAPLFQNLLTATLGTVPVIFRHFFRLAAIAAVTAFKVGWVTGISLKELITSSIETEDVKAIMADVGKKSAVAFFVSGDWSALGGKIQKAFSESVTKEDFLKASDLLPPSLKQEVQNILRDNFDIKPSGLGASVDKAAQNVADAFIGRLKTGLSEDQISNALGAVKKVFSETGGIGLVDALAGEFTKVQTALDAIIALAGGGEEKIYSLQVRALKMRMELQAQRKASDQEAINEDINARAASLLEIERLEKESNERLMQNRIESYSNLKDFNKIYFSNAAEAITGFNQTSINLKQKALKKEEADATYWANKSIKNIENKVATGVMTEQQGADKIAIINANLNANLDDMRAKSLEDQKANANIQKAINIGLIGMQTALAIMNVWAEVNPFKGFGVRLAESLLLGVVGVSQAASVATQSFAFGGDVRPVADSVPAMLRPKEIVSTPEANDMFGDEITRMNQEAIGGGSGAGSGGINVYINAVDGESVYRVIVDNKDKFASGFREVVKSGHLQMAGR